MGRSGSFRKWGWAPVALGLVLVGGNAFGAGNRLTVDGTQVLLGLLGGLAFFLYGMEMMSEGMKRAAGAKMRSLLARMTQNRVRGLVVGTFVTMMVQSSSATTVMLVGFVQSELLRFSQTLGVILGAGIGSTFTAQLIAFKMTDYALLMVAVGFLWTLSAKREKTGEIGRIVLGFGILFYGMKLMSDAMVPLRTDPVLLEMLQSFSSPILGILAGVGITALIQSSGAVTGILIVLAGQGLVTVDAAVPVVLGSNVGTCVTALIAGITASREAKRVAAAHTFFKMFGVLVLLPFLPFFLGLLEGLGGGVGRQVANAHTLFNIAVAVIFLPFTGPFGRFIMKIVPEGGRGAGLPRYQSPLEKAKIVSAEVALELARSEISRMAGVLKKMLRAMSLTFVANGNGKDPEFPELDILAAMNYREGEIDFLERVIGRFLFEVAREPSSEDQTQTIYAMISIIKDLESIGDLVEKNARHLYEKKAALDSDFSEEGKDELAAYYEKVLKQISRLQDAFSERDLDKAGRIMKKEEKYMDLESEFRIRHLDRIICRREESVETHEVHMELLNLMTRIITYTGNIAKTYVTVVKAREGVRS